MRKYILGSLVLIVAIGGFLYADLASPRAQARDTAIAFWQAVAAQDEEAVRSLLAPGAPTTAESLLTTYAGIQYNGYRPEMGSALSNRAGVKWIASNGVLSRGKTTHSVMAALKLVDGHWLVYAAGEGFSY
jgi:hypothetical protein